MKNKNTQPVNEFFSVNDNVIPQIYQEGWVCPKCGGVMSPYQPYCINCQPKDIKVGVYPTVGTDPFINTHSSGTFVKNPTTTISEEING